MTTIDHFHNTSIVSSPNNQTLLSTICTDELNKQTSKEYSAAVSAGGLLQQLLLAFLQTFPLFCMRSLASENITL